MFNYCLNNKNAWWNTKTLCSAMSAILKSINLKVNKLLAYAGGYKHVIKIIFILSL